MSQQYKSGIITGYKATDSEMKCRGHQFELGVWYEVGPGDIIKCGGNGFHFCPHASGPWAYYRDPGTRLFKVEAEGVLDLPATPGADEKYVCRRIRLVSEIIPDGDSNTGYSNTGNGNTGYSNTGNGNTGDSNTGYSNTGHRNTGHRNTGNGNTGNGNTGNGNACNHSTGFLGTVEPLATCFDLPTGLTHAQMRDNHASALRIACDYATGILEALDDAAAVAVSSLPNYSLEGLESLRAAHLAKRKETK